jgi:ABC-type Fe3+ transport system permease subunit
MKRTATFGFGPWIAAAALVFLPALIVLGAIAFTTLSTWDMTSGRFVGFPTMASFVDAASAGRLSVLGSQVARAVLVATLDVIIAAPAAHFLVRRVGARTRIAVLVLFMVPFFINGATRGFAWKSLLGHDGPVGDLLGLFGASDDVRHSLLHNSFSVLLSLVSSSISFALFPIVGILASLRRNLWELCGDLGLDTASEFFLSAIPLASKGMAYGWITAFIVVALSAIEIDLTGGSNQESLSRVIKGLFDKNDPNAAVAMGVLLLVSIALILSAFYCISLVLRRVSVQALPFDIPGFGVIEVLCLAGAALLVLAPGLDVVLGTAAEVLRLGTASGEAVNPMRSLLQDPRIRTAITNTAIVCLCVSLPATLAAVMAALTWWDSREFRTMIVIAFAFAAIPGEAYAIGIFSLLKILGWNIGPFGAVILAQVAWTFPFCLMTAATGFAGIRKNTLLAADDLGATRYGTLFRLVIPACWPEIALTLLVGAVLSLNEFSRVYFLSGRNELLSEYIAGRLKSGGDISDYMLASFGTLVGFLVVGCFLACWLQSTSKKLRGSLQRQSEQAPAVT